MAEDTNFFERYAAQIGAQIHVAAPARVVNVYGTTSADVQTLYKTEEGDGHFILAAPILKHVGLVSEGDVVYVSFADRPLDHMNGNKSFAPEFSDRHRVIDGVVIGVFPS
ncbi:hypothetical protein [Domibacillus aminovorans]|uniref:Phage protein Gp138 N-terminal domain-containing protein n=1 Tax=Domibacillus aminovorans TaxID=29332 RepID=A0A177L887_9BACI|nr:hypothetical protein [Domibacillus aminovorans]OAH61950.1 hypothetical protein AWH49_11040 [Domibacillus aminovorans]